MTDIDFDTLNLTELKTLQKRLEKAISSYEARQKAKAIEAAEQAIKPFGLSLNDLGLSGPKVRKPVEPKYRNPANPDQTWTGRGRKPAWVNEAEAAGQSLNDHRI